MSFVASNNGWTKIVKKAGFFKSDFKPGFLIVAIFFLYALIIASFIFRPTPSLAVTSTYIGPDGGSWQNAANWDNGIPTSTINALVSSSTAITVNATGTLNFNQLQIGGDVASSTLMLTGNFGTSTNVTIANNGKLQQDNSVRQTIAGTLLIQSGGTLTHSTNTTAFLFNINFSANTTTINAGGAVNVDGLGYSGGGTGLSGSGPGGGLGGADSVGSGGAHGGNGGDAFSSVYSNGGKSYCALSNVATIGSGGGGAASALLGGSGGGLIILNATNTLTINGIISAQGGNGVGNDSGGGAGGGVKLTANTIAGSPTLFSIVGGTGHNNTGASGGGGGGCALLTYTVSNSITSSSVSMSGGTGGLNQGGAGQLLLKPTTGNGDLYVVSNATVVASSTQNENLTLNSLSLSNSVYLVTSTKTLTFTNTGNPFNTSTNSSTLGVAGTITLNYNTIDHGVNMRLLNGSTFINSTTLNIGTSGGVGGLRLDSGSTVSSTITTLTSSGTIYLIRGAIFTINNFTINAGTTTLGSYTTSSVPLTLSGNFIMNGGVLNHERNSTAQTNIINLSANNITIASGASVNVDGLGYAGGASGASGSGPGGGSSLDISGGSHGGNGGSRSGPIFLNYCVLGNLSTIGSGGAGGAIAGSGGNGGGLIILNATTTMTINGAISAVGSNGNAGTIAASGGAGGGVKLTAATIAGTPSLFSINGGGAGTGIIFAGNGGGGGCAFVHYSTTSTITPSILTYAGGVKGAALGGDTSSVSGTIGIISVARTPAAPTLGAIAANSVALSWANSGGTETYYVLQRSLDGLTYTTVATTTPTTTVSYSFTGLTANTQYWLGVGAGDSSNVTSSFSTTTVRTAAVPSSGSTGSSPALSSAPPTAPQPPAITLVINNGALTTYSPLASIQAKGGDNPSSIQLSNDVSFTGSQWQPYTGGSIAWTLSPGSGWKIVYAMLRDNKGTSAVVSSSIQYLGNDPSSTIASTTMVTSSASSIPSTPTSTRTTTSPTSTVPTTPSTSTLNIITIPTSTPSSPSSTVATTTLPSPSLDLVPGKTYKFLQFIVNVYDKKGIFSTVIELLDSNGYLVGQAAKVSKTVVAHSTLPVTISYLIPKNLPSGDYTLAVYIYSPTKKLVAVGQRAARIKQPGQEQVLGAKIRKVLGTKIKARREKINVRNTKMTEPVLKRPVVKKRPQL